MVYKYTYPLIFVLLILSGCQTAYYSAMEKVGIHKRQILIDRVEDTADSQEQAKQEFKDALTQLSSLISFDGGELQRQYEESEEHYQVSKSAADEVSQRIDAVESVADALFDEWQEEINQFTNKDFKRKSKASLIQTQSKYNRVLKSMRNAESRMFPILSALKDNMLYLKHNLNAQAIGALKVEYRTIKENVEELINDMNRSIDHSQQFIDSLKVENS
jgi:hypothetical protein